jgi:hypothetical protein
MSTLAIKTRAFRAPRHFRERSGGNDEDADGLRIAGLHHSAAILEDLAVLNAGRRTEVRLLFCPNIMLTGVLSRPPFGSFDRPAVNRQIDVHWG